MSSLVLLGRPDCHLCHEMRDVVRRVVGDAAFVERDVAADPDLEKRYVFEIPVLLWGAHEVVRHRTTETALRARLAALGFPTSRS